MNQVYWDYKMLFSPLRMWFRAAAGLNMKWLQTADEKMTFTLSLLHFLSQGEPWLSFRNATTPFVQECKWEMVSLFYWSVYWNLEHGSAVNVLFGWNSEMKYVYTVTALTDAAALLFISPPSSLTLTCFYTKWFSSEAQTNLNIAGADKCYMIKHKGLSEC